MLPKSVIACFAICGVMQSRSTQATEQFRRLPYADVCENNELRTYCISTSRYRLGRRKASQPLIV
jgi:hypothetical protein